MLPAGFEPAVPECERRQNLALDHSATGIGQSELLNKKYHNFTHRFALTYQIGLLP